MLNCLFLLLFSLQSMFFGQNWTPIVNGYSYQKTITIDHTKVGASDSTSFPMLVSGTYSYLATVANGGKVQSTSGYDIIFTSDIGCVTPLKWEQESWSATTGAVIYWVQIPTLSHTSNTIIYVCYGNSAIVSFQGGASGAAYDSTFGGVYHLPNGVTLTASDSTTNGNTGTLSGSTVPWASAGEIDGAANFDGSSSYVDLGTGSTLNPTSGMTLSTWVNFTSIWVSGGQRDTWLISRDVNSGTRSYDLGLYGYSNGGRWVLQINGTDLIEPTVVAITLGAWYWVLATGDSTNGYTLYVNGSPVGTHAWVAPNASSGTHSNLGRRAYATLNGYLNGLLDECRVANVWRSADWVTAEYNNQSSPSTFYSGF